MYLILFLINKIQDRKQLKNFQNILEIILSLGKRNKWRCKGQKKRGLVLPAPIKRSGFFTFTPTFFFEKCRPPFIFQGIIKHNIKRKTKETKQSHTNLKKKLI